MTNDWLEVELGKIVELNPKILNKSEIDDELEVQFLPMKLVEEVSNKIHLDEIRKFKEVQKKSYTYFAEGDVLFAKVTPCMENGKIAVANGLKNGIGFGSSEFHVLRCSKILLNKFMFFYIVQEEFRRNAQHEMTGAVGLRRVPTNHLKHYRFPLPPLPIQHAIVAKIEALFSDLDNGIADLKKAQEQLKVYRQAVLKKAFEGKLAGTVIEGDGFDKLDKINKQAVNLPNGWKWIKSKELFSFVTSGSRGWAKYYSDNGAIFIRITNLNFDTLELDLSPSKIQYVNPPMSAEGIRTKVQEGDFLFSITGYLGMFAIAPKIENAYVNQHVSLCRPKDNFDKKYVGYWIISESGGIYHFNKNKKGAVKAGLTLDDLKSFMVPFPSSLPEQHQIVREIESRLSVCDKVEQNITEALEKSEALRQSILKKAFEGKLLSTAEIAKCKQEVDYEPASELLKKIKMEKK